LVTLEKVEKRLCGRYLLRNFDSVPSNIVFSQNLSV
jgi:hypothetical protein